MQTGSNENDSAMFSLDLYTHKFDLLGS